MHEHGGGADPFFSHDGDMEKRRGRCRGASASSVMVG
jgi:hypothetical protein